MNRWKVLARHDPESDRFDRQRLIEGWDQERLRTARILVVGAGAIGNEVLKNLALLGVGYLFVVDFDRVAESNLSRTVLFRPDDRGRPKAALAAERARELCLEPSARIDSFDGDLVWELGTGLYRRFDLVLGCLDNLEARIAVNRRCREAGVPWIDAGMHQLACRVSVFPPDGEVCFECGLSAAQLEKSRERYSCDQFKRVEAAAGRAPTTQVTGALVAALQVQEAVKLLCGQRVATGERLSFRGTLNDLASIPLTPREGCPAHATAARPTSLGLTLDATLRELLTAVSAADACGEGAELDLSAERGFVVRARCRGCSQWLSVMAPPFRVYETELRCAACRKNGPGPSGLAAGLPTEKEVLGRYRLDLTPADVLDLSLAALGVPHLAELPVRSAGGAVSRFGLDGDEPRVMPNLQVRGAEGAPAR